MVGMGARVIVAFSKDTKKLMDFVYGKAAKNLPRPPGMSPKEMRRSIEEFRPKRFGKSTTATVVHTKSPGQRDRS